MSVGRDKILWDNWKDPYCILHRYFRENLRTHSKISSPGEVLSVLVERRSHDSICCVEGLLHAVAMVDIDVDVEDTLVAIKKIYIWS